MIDLIYAEEIEYYNEPEQPTWFTKQDAIEYLTILHTPEQELWDHEYYLSIDNPDNDNSIATRC